MPTKTTPTTRRAVKAKPAPKGAKAKPQAAKPAPAKPARRLSGLSAAAQVLAEAKAPMNAHAIVKALLDQGLWQTGGKTPHATIYAAMIREIATKGKEARFRKVGRGAFAAA